MKKVYETIKNVDWRGLFNWVRRNLTNIGGTILCTVIAIGLVYGTIRLIQWDLWIGLLIGFFTIGVVCIIIGDFFD